MLWNAFKEVVVYTMVHFRKKILILVSQPFVLHAGAIKISIKSAISGAAFAPNLGQNYNEQKIEHKCTHF